MFNDTDYVWKKKVIVSYSLSILVFWIHCSTFANYEPLPLWVKTIAVFFKDVITPVAVPLFMIISGALFYRNYSKIQYCSKIKKRFYSLFIPFILWNSINMLFLIIATAFLSQYFIGREPFVFSTVNIVEGIFRFKYNIPFWFVFDLIIFTIIAPLFYFIICRKKIAICAIVLIYLYNSMYETRLSELFFFNKRFVIYYMVGAYVGRYAFNDFIKKSTYKTSFMCFLCLLVVWAYYTAVSFKIIQNPYFLNVPVLLFACYCIWNVFDALCDTIELKPFMTHSLWVFALHTNISAIITKLLYIILPKTAVFSLLNFMVTTVLTLITIELIYISTEKAFPMACRLLSGGR